jgi:hypothetical protein
LTVGVWILDEDDAGAEATLGPPAEHELTHVDDRDWFTTIVENAGDGGRRLRNLLEIHEWQDLGDLPHIERVSVLP